MPTQFDFSSVIYKFMGFSMKKLVLLSVIAMFAMLSFSQAKCKKTEKINVPSTYPMFVERGDSSITIHIREVQLLSCLVVLVDDLNQEYVVKNLSYLEGATTEFNYLVNGVEKITWTEDNTIRLIPVGDPRSLRIESIKIMFVETMPDKKCRVFVYETFETKL